MNVLHYIILKNSLDCENNYTVVYLHTQGFVPLLQTFHKALIGPMHVAWIKRVHYLSSWISQTMSSSATNFFFFFNKHTWGYLVKTPQASSPCGIFSPAKESDLNSCLQHSGSSNGTGITSFLPFNQVNDKGIRSWVFSSCWQSRASTIIHHFIKNIP